MLATARTRLRTLRPNVALLLVAAGLVAGTTACAGDSNAATTDDGLLTEAPRADLVVEGQHYRPEVLRFASISGADEESSAERQKLIIDFVSEHIGYEIEFIETTDYSSVIEAMRAGRVDFASFGPFSYVIAASEANATAVAAQPNQETGELGYHSLLITHADSGLDTIEDLKGKTIAFGDPASTSGNLFPRLMLAKAGVEVPEDYFAETIYSGGHDASLVAVTNNQVDVAGVCDTCIERYFREGLASERDIKVIAESDAIPPSPVSVRADLDPELRQAIADAYVALITEAPEIVQEANSLDELPTHPYQEMSDADYDVIRELADTLEVDLAELD